MKWVICVGILVVSSVAAFGQDGANPTKPKVKHALSQKKGGKSTGSPVTKSEARTVFTRVESVLADSEIIPKSVMKTNIAPGKQPATRDELLAEMYSIYNKVKPSFKITPRPIKPDPSAIRNLTPASKQIANQLIKMGCLARLGPIVSGPGPNLTTSEFGDALGYFLARISELTNMPSSKWTPMLHE